MLTQKSEKSNNQWNVVQHKKRTRIVGNNKDSTIKTVPKCVDLHVYRLHPDITDVNLKVY